MHVLHNIFLFLSLHVAVFENVQANNLMEYSEEIQKDFSAEINNFLNTGIESIKLQQLYNSMRLPKDIRYEELTNLPEEMGLATCLACRTAFATLLDLRKNNASVESLSKLAIEVCVNLNIQPRQVCENLIHLNAPIFAYVADHRPSLTAKDACAIIAQTESCGAPKDKMFELNIDIIGETSIKDHKKGSPDSGEYYKIIQIADVHFDPHYTVSSNAKCDEPTCCRLQSGAPTTPADGAGKWGDYRSCDIPLETIASAFKSIKEAHSDVNYIYFTGDIIDHGIWETSQSANKLSMEKVYKLMEKELKYIPIFPLLGNHEAHPVNQYAPLEIEDSELSSKWLYEYVADTWSTWLPYHSIQTVRKGGYYTAFIEPGFRLISLNNNDCYIYNFWLLSGSNFLSKQLIWLQETLLKAEANNEKVHILRHLPAGRAGCFSFWTREYTKIVERFSHIIAAQFEGHTHRNELTLFYDSKTASHATNVAFNGGSITPYSNVNPNYMVYYVDKTSLEVVDFESYMFNLTEANMNPYREPVWHKGYSFKEHWELEDLSPASIHGLVEKLATDEKLLLKYWRQKVKQGDPFLEEGCDKKCLEKHLCSIVTSNFEDERRCKALIGRFKQ